jgi:hypothetical protein
MASMRKPLVGKPRSAAAAFSLSRKLPKLKMPLSAATVSVPRPRPQVGRPGAPVIAGPASAPHEVAREIAQSPDGDALCTRCGHGESEHPVRYVCDKYPYPDPLQICGCEAATLDDPCPHCGHSARRHKPRHRCRAGASCSCWAFEGD